MHRADTLTSLGYALAALALLLAPAAYAEVRAPTDEEKNLMQYLGLKVDMIDTTTVTRLKGGCDGNPYAILESRYKGGSNVQITPHAADPTSTALRAGIDPALACRLTKLFEAAGQRGCQVRVISAYRSAQQQQNMCGAGRSGCAPAGKSCHQYGLAIDVSAACIPWLRQNAPQFGLTFPYYGDHIQCAEHRVASCSPSTQPCNGSLAITPNNVTSMAPLGLGDAFRRAIQPQQTQAPIQQALPQAQQQGLQSAFSGTATGGTTGTVGTTQTDTSVGSAFTQNKPSQTSGTSTQDLLRSLAYSTSTETATTTSVRFVPIAIDTRDIGRLRPDEGAQQRLPQDGGIAYAPTTGAPNTFTSPDLNPGLYSPAAPQTQSSLQATLASIKARLLALLGALQPFGGRAVAPQEGETE